MTSSSLALQRAMQAQLVASAELRAVLGGAYVFDEVPRGAPPSYVEFTALETRDWSTAEAAAHEHFVSIAVRSNSRSRVLAQEAAAAVGAALDGAALVLDGHRLVNLRMVFWNVSRSGQNFGANLRFRAATEPLI